jgi:hypothetical protein
MTLPPRDKKREVIEVLQDARTRLEEWVGGLDSEQDEKIIIRINSAIDALEAAEAQQPVSSVPQTTLEQIYDQWKRAPITHGCIVFAGDNAERFESRASFYGGYMAALANIPPAPTTVDLSEVQLWSPVNGYAGMFTSADGEFVKLVDVKNKLKAPTMSREEIKRKSWKAIQENWGDEEDFEDWERSLDVIANALEGRIPAGNQSDRYNEAMNTIYKVKELLENDGTSNFLDDIQELKEQLADLERQHAEDVEKINNLMARSAFYENRAAGMDAIVQKQKEFLDHAEEMVKPSYKDRLEAMVRETLPAWIMVHLKTEISSTFGDIMVRSEEMAFEQSKSAIERLDRVTEAKE